MNTKHMEDAAAEVHHALEIRTLEQALEEKNAQLAEKANQIETYKKVVSQVVLLALFLASKNCKSIILTNGFVSSL